MKITKSEFLKWLRKQPATREFNYVEHRTCLFASFLSEHCMLPDVSCGGFTYTLLKEEERRIFPTWMRNLGIRVCIELDRVFSISDVRKLLKN